LGERGPGMAAGPVCDEEDIAVAGVVDVDVEGEAEGETTGE
jgi:hypothetical protein